MSEFDNEVNRGLDGLVRTTNYRDWVNPEDPSDKELLRTFRASPVSQQEVEKEGNESVDGLPVQDRDVVEEDVPRRFLGENLDEDESRVEEGGEVVRGNLEDSDAVPEGNIREVTKWVGDDKDKAQRALDVEKQKENPRKSLIEKLEEVIED